MYKLLDADIEKLIGSEPMVLTRTGWSYHPPVLDENGELVLGYPQYDSFTGIAKRFRKAGVRINLTNLPNGWVGENRFDYRSVDRTLDELFREVPDTFYIPRIRLDPPIDWLEHHPEEVFLFEDSPRDLCQIAEAIRRRDISGIYDMKAEPEGRGVQPLIWNGSVGQQSFTSSVWLKDAETALRNLLRHLLSTPYSDRLIGFHIGYGWTGELMTWSLRSERFGDYSRKHASAFLNYAMKKYGSLEAVREKWNLPEMSLDNPMIPPGEWRRGTGKEDLRSFMGGDEYGRICHDYVEFVSDSNCDAIEALAHAAKEEAPGRAVGTFFGYFVTGGGGPSIGHLGLGRLLDCPDIDYFAAPKSYSHPLAGEPGGCSVTQLSVMRKKHYIDETDIRTHLAQFQICPGCNVEAAANLQETTTVLWREFCKNEANGVNYWWMDQGQAGHNWYADDGIMNVISQIVKAHHEINQRKRQSIAQTLVIINEHAMSFPYKYPPLHSAFVSNVLLELSKSGMIYELYRDDDLEELDLSQYRLIVFLNCWKADAERMKRIKERMNPNANILWNYAVGSFNAKDEYDPEGTVRITGFQLAENHNSVNPAFPDLTIVRKPGMEVLLEDENHLVRMAASGREIMNCQPDLTADVFRKLAQRAKLHLYSAENAIIYGDGRFTGVFSIGPLEGEITLPEAGEWHEIITGNRYAHTDKIPVKMNAKDVRVFVRV